MHNHSFSNEIHHFLVHGGDRRSTNRLKWVAMGQLPLLMALYWMKPEWIVAGVIAYVISLGVWFWWMTSGQSERYLVQINLKEATITAEDRVEKREMWSDDFQPAWVRISEIQVILSGEVYRHPALVYSEQELELIMDAVPDTTKILLGMGELEEVQQVKARLTAGLA